MLKDLNYYLSRTIKIGDCLEWIKCLNSDGYPRVVVNGYANGKAHREVFFLVHGFYPPVVRHRCDNIKCINPDHLEAGTPVDNMRDRHERKRTAGYVTNELSLSVRSLRLDGLTYKQIAEKLDISRKRVDYILNWKKER